MPKSTQTRKDKSDGKYTKPHPSLHLFTKEQRCRDEALYIYWCWNETCKLDGNQWWKPGNSKLISQSLHVAGKSSGEFGKDGLTKEMVHGSCVCITVYNSCLK